MEDINSKKKEIESKENDENIDPVKSKIGLVLIAIITIFIIGFIWFVAINPKCDFTTDDYHIIFANNIEKSHIYYNIEKEECLYTVKIKDKYKVKNDDEYYKIKLFNTNSNIVDSHYETVVLSKTDYNKFIGEENNAIKANVYNYNLLFSRNIEMNSNIGFSEIYVVYPWTEKNDFENELSTKEFLQNEAKRFLKLKYEDLDYYQFGVSDDIKVNGEIKKLYE